MSKRIVNNYVSFQNRHCLDVISCFPVVGLAVIGGRCANIQSIFDAIEDNRSYALRGKDLDYWNEIKDDPTKKQPTKEGVAKIENSGILRDFLIGHKKCKNGKRLSVTFLHFLCPIK